MPWTLRSALDTGDLDTSNADEVKVVRMTHDSNRGFILVDLEYGNTVGGVWTPTAQPANKTLSHMVSGRDYVTLVTTHTSNDGELTYAAVKRGIYEHLNAAGILDAGSVT